MKRTETSEQRVRTGNLRKEYRFDYSKAQPNRFAGKVAKQPVVVALDEDVAKVFKSTKAVNSALRSLLLKPPKTRLKKAS